MSSAATACQGGGGVSLSALAGGVDCERYLWNESCHTLRSFDRAGRDNLGGANEGENFGKTSSETNVHSREPQRDRIRQQRR
jgi:hypothetical protein